MLKKIISIFLVMVMLLGMSVPVMATGYDITDSTVGEDGETDAQDINVSVRVIGAKLGDSNPSFSSSKYDYKGAEYQTWARTKTISVKTGTAVEALFYEVLKEAGMQYSSDSGKISVTAPPVFGGHNMIDKKPNSSNSYWCCTIIDENGETKYEKKVSTNTDELTDKYEGCKVIFHFVLNYSYEAFNGTYSSKHPAIVQAYLDISDDTLTIAEQNVVDLIAAIGEVVPTPECGAAIKKARDEYNGLPDDSKMWISDDAEKLFAAEVEYERIKDITDEDRINLPAPESLSVNGEAGLYSITLDATVPGIDSTKYQVLYSASVDGENWGEWQASATFDKLLPAKTYYFRAMAKTKDWALYNNSEISGVLSVSTKGSQDSEFDLKEVYSKETLAEVLSHATTSGILTKVVLTKDIVINYLEGQDYTVTIPEGANILLTGKDLYLNEGGMSSYIGVTKDTVVTIRDMTVASTNFTNALGVDNTFSASSSEHNVLRFLDPSAVINLENVRLYNELTKYGVIGCPDSMKQEYQYKSGTLNIYSGVYRGIDSTAFLMDGKYQNTGKVNLIPTGNILIEGIDDINSVHKVKEINLIPTLASLVSGAVLEEKDGNYAHMSESQLQGKNYKCGYGIRIYTESPTDTLPIPMAAPVVLPADDENAENADVTYTVTDNTIQLTVKNRYGKNDNAIIQFMSKQLQRNTWHSFSDVVEGDTSGLNSTFTYTKNNNGKPLTKDTPYEFQIRYASLDSNYTDGVTKVTISTSFTPETLNPPVLVDQAEKDAYSITLTAPEASSEDSTATFEYRKSVDGVSWGKWQESPAFDNLEPGTKYYFQSRYKAVHKYWLDSAESNTIELSTITATLTAPELSAEGAVITANTIELSSVAASAQDVSAIVKYFLSTDGQEWNDGQESPIFTGLNDNTKYYFKAQYISSNNNKYLDSADSNVIEITTKLSSDSPVFVVSEVIGRTGKTVDVTVEMKNNPGIISAAFDVSYDRDKLELTGVSDGSLLPNFSKSQNFETHPYHVNWEDSTAEVNNIQNGILVTFTFKVKDTCKAGDTAEIIISYDENNIYDVNETNVKFHIVNGSVTVDDHNWSEITYTWSEDHTTCTASRACTDDDCSEEETETVTASAVHTPSSCTVEGKDVYTAAFVNGAFETQTYTENFGTLPHSYVTVSGADNAALVKKCSCTHTEEVTVDENTPVIVIADTHSNNKNEIKVAVSVKNNPGFKAMSFTLDFDSSKLQFVSAENKTTLTNLVSDGNVITLGSAGENTNYTENGDIVILTFKALTDCEGQPVALTYNIADITNADGEAVLFAIDNGKVSAINYTAGDVNGDGKVELKDVTYLRRHLAGWDGYTDIVKFAGDVDGDGTVGQLDVAYLLRHVAEYEGYEVLGRK